MLRKSLTWIAPGLAEYVGSLGCRKVLEGGHVLV